MNIVEALAACQNERDFYLHSASRAHDEAAKSQADNARLREALNQMCLSAELPKEFDSYPSQLSYSLVLAREALAQPHDDTALRQYVAKELREMAGDEFQGVNIGWRYKLRRRADELENGRDCPRRKE